ncbi:hypothetical protein Scep_022314 [Stephania cephalantha]|uniref:Uncharacterized protein n=1 Tax=Stephania cephalantha TaxID=152367 RepID=A0AAP0F7Q4_9MAGN
MAFTSLAATSITLSSIIGVFVSTTTNSKSSSEIVYGSKNPIINSVKHFSVLLCFLFAFLCNIQSIRYYSHVSFLMTLPAMTDHDDIDDDSHSRGDMVCYVARCLNRGSYFWSLGLRGFYLAFPLFLWTFGPIPMFACCCAMPGVLYFLDTTASFAVKLKEFPLKVKMMTTNHDVELPCTYSTSTVH